MNITEELKKQVWTHGQVVKGYAPDEVRKDACGAFMIYNDYGKQSLYGWQIDHVCPASILREFGYSEDIIDDVQNLRPMQWQNNESKSDDYPSYTSVITSDGDQNVEREESKIVNAIRQKHLQELFPKLKKD